MENSIKDNYSKVGFNNVIIISKSYFIFGLLLLIYIPSPYLRTIEAIDIIYKILQYIISVVIVQLWIKNRSDNVAWFILIGLFYCSFTFFSFLNNASISIIRSSLSNMFISLSLLMLIDLYIHKDFLKTLKTLEFVLTILFLINFITVIIKPDGLYIAIESNGNVGYFLGMRNDTIEYILPLLSVLLLEQFLFNRSILRLLFFGATAIMTYIISHSTNALLCVIFLFCYNLIFYKGKPKKIFNTYYFLMLSFLLSIGIILLGIQDNFEFLITQILGKSLTFSGRTRIWYRSIQYIKLRPLLGYGIEDSYTKYLHIGATNSCHNYFLDILYYGGIIFLFLFIVFLLFNFHKIRVNTKDKSFEIMSVIFGSYFILWIATPIHRNTLCYMFMIWLLLYSYKDDISNKNLQ